MARAKGRAWHMERAKRKGGSNVRGNRREKWERSKVRGHTRRVNGKKVRVKAYRRHKGKRRR